MSDRITEPQQNDNKMMESGRSPSNKTASASRSARRPPSSAGLWAACLLAMVLALMPGASGAQTSPGVADLSVTVSASHTVAVMGEEVTFTATYVNNGPDSASDVRLSFTSDINGWEYISGATTSGTLVTVSSQSGAVIDEVELPLLPAGDSVTLTIVLNPTSAIYNTTCYANIAADNSTTTDPVWENDSTNATVIAVRQGATLWDLTSKAFPANPSLPVNTPGQLYANEDATFEVTVLNRGPVEATSVSLANVLYNTDPFYQNPTPATGMVNLRTDVVTSGSVTGAQADGINLTVQSIAPGSSVVFRMTYTLTEAKIYWLTSTATIPDDITDQPEKTSVAAIEVLAGQRPPNADLSVVTTADRTEVPFGENTVVRVAMTNNGPAPAYDITASFLAAGFLHLTDIISVESTAGTVEAFTAGSIIDSGMRMTLTQLNPGQTETMTLVFRNKRYSEIWAWTASTYDHTRSIDPDTGNNQNPILILKTTGEPPVYDLQANITASPAAAQRGGLLVYNMSVTNSGPDDVPTTITLSNQWAKITFPQWGLNGPVGPLIVEDGDVEFLSIQDSGQWSLNVGDQGLLASLPFLAAGETANLVLVYKVSPEAVGDELGNINNSIAVRNEWLAEADTDNNAAIASTPISTGGGAEADLLITHSGSAQPVALNQPVSYTVTATNLGPNPTSAAYVSYLVPQGATLASVTSDKGTPVVINKYASVADVPLAVGEAVTLTVNIVPEQVGQLASLSAGSTDLFDPNVGNNFSEDSTLVVESLPGEEPPVIEPPVVEPPVVTPEQPCISPVDLSAQIIKYRAKGKPKKKTGEWQYRIQANVGITNLGTACAPATTVKLYLSDDLTLDSSDLLLATKNIKLKCPGKKAWKAKKVNFKMKLDKGVSPAGRYIIAVADADNMVPECNEDNNNATAF